MDKEIGRIIEVRGINIKAKLFRLLPPYLINNGKIVSAPKINSFVKTKVGLDTIICQVVGEYNIEKDDRTLDYYIDLQVKGYIDKQQFIQGLRMLPIVSANLSLLNDEDYKVIYDFDDENSFVIGKDLFEINKEIRLNYNNVMPSHIGIFGNTGSGKSNTLTNVLSHYIEKLNSYEGKKAKVLVFDLNNEYGNNSICNEDQKTIYNLTTRKDSEKKIPFNFNDIDEDEMCTLLNASAKTQAPTLKNAFKNLKKNREETYYLDYIVNILKNNRKDLFFSIRFYLSNYLGNSERISWFNKKENSAFVFKKEQSDWIFSDNVEFQEEIMNNIKISMPEDKLDRLIFELCFAIAKECEHGINSEYLLPLLHRADKLFSDLKKVFDFKENMVDLFEGKSISVIQLANVNSDMSMIIPSLISNILFKKQLEEKADGTINSIVNIVIDEAHNILYKDEESKIHERVLASFEKIVKEGRKFGVFLIIASQRPSDISNTVLSQLHNYLIHKLVNPNDLYQIRKTVAFLDESALNFLTILAPGECIVSGTSVKMPVFLQVDELNDDIKPNSNNVILFGKNGIIKH